MMPAFSSRMTSAAMSSVTSPSSNSSERTRSITPSSAPLTGAKPSLLKRVAGVRVARPIFSSSPPMPPIRARTCLLLSE